MNQSGKYINFNLIVDINRAAPFFTKNYFAIKAALTAYVAIQLALHISVNTSTDSRVAVLEGSDAFGEVFLVEDPAYQGLYRDIVCNLIHEKLALEAFCFAEELPRKFLENLLEDVHEAVNRHIYHAVTSVMNHYDNYTGKNVLVSTTLLNQNTLLVSFKTIEATAVPHGK